MPIILDDPVAMTKLRALWSLEDTIKVLERSLVASRYPAPSAADLQYMLNDVITKWELE